MPTLPMEEMIAPRRGVAIARASLRPRATTTGFTSPGEPLTAAKPDRRCTGQSWSEPNHIRLLNLAYERGLNGGTNEQSRIPDRP